MRLDDSEAKSGSGTSPSNGGGSQDSIDSLEAILHLNGCQQRTAGYGDAKDGKELDMEDMERLEKLTFTEVTAWHNTQLKAAIPEKKYPNAKEIHYSHPIIPETYDSGWKHDAEAMRNYGYNQAITDILANLEKP